VAPTEGMGRPNQIPTRDWLVSGAIKQNPMGFNNAAKQQTPRQGRLHNSSPMTNSFERWS
jgi:hypothetical protein